MSRSCVDRNFLQDIRCGYVSIHTALQHLETLLGAPNQDVVTATLQTLVALVRKTHIASIRFPGSQEQNARLLAFAQGWGGKEQVRLLATETSDASVLIHSSHATPRVTGPKH